MTQVHTMVPMVVMFAAGLALCGQNPFSLKPSAVARRAQMTPSQQARQILGPTASNDTVVGVADIIAQAAIAQAQAAIAQAQAQAEAQVAQAQVAQAQAQAQAEAQVAQAQAQAEAQVAQAQVAQAQAEAQVAQAQAGEAKAHRMYLEKEKHRLEETLFLPSTEVTGLNSGVV